MRLAACVIALLCAAACDPEIGAGTYYCGPELLCPPDLDCDPNTFTCDVPGSFPAFACPEGSEANEPDDVAADATALGQLVCNYNAEIGPICVDDLADADMFAFSIGPCDGADPHVELEIRYPIAMAPLVVDVLDSSEAVVASGELCTPEQNFTGMDWVCVSMPAVEGDYFIRVRSRGDIDCDGACPFNTYRMILRYPLA
jgi:hypothetical protein